MDWIFAPPPKKKKKLVLNSNPQRDGMWRWDLGEVIRSWGQAFRNGISVLRKEAPESPLLICTNTARRSIIYEPRRWFSLDSESASTLILNFPASTSERNIFLSFISHPATQLLLSQPEQMETLTVASMKDGCFLTYPGLLSIFFKLRRTQLFVIKLSLT